MKRFLPAVVTAALLALLVAFSANAKPAWEASVRPLAWTDVVVPGDDDPNDLVFHPETLQSGASNHCTAWATKVNGTQYWMTAAHCVVNDTGAGIADRDYQIGGVAVHPVLVDVTDDVAAMIGGPKAPGLDIAQEQGDVESDLIIRGYPFGSDNLVTTRGILSGLLPPFKEDPGHLMYNVAAAPGNSGSPVFNKHNEVVGVLQVSYCVGLWEGFCPVTGGVPYVSLKSFIGNIDLLALLSH